MYAARQQERSQKRPFRKAPVFETKPENPDEGIPAQDDQRLSHNCAGKILAVITTVRPPQMQKLGKH
jgi:hypothetical protein